MSAFDDEFGLFGDDDAPAEDERKPTLGARKIASNETIIDEIEPEDDRPPRRRGASGGGAASGDRRPPRFADRGPRAGGDPAVAQARATELLHFLATKLVSKPGDVVVAVVEGSRGPVIELEVHPDDFGKVIGKGGRVAQALRTIVRATAEGRVSVDIVDVEDDDEHEQDLEHAGDTTAPHDEAEARASGAITDADAPVAIVAQPDDDDANVDADAESDAVDADAAASPSGGKKAPARKKRAATTGTRRKKKS